MPLTDAARVLVLSHFVKGINNTAARFEKLATLEPNNKELYLSCSYATKALLKFRTKQGILHHDSGRYLDLNTLSKEERVKLKEPLKQSKKSKNSLILGLKYPNCCDLLFFLKYTDQITHKSSPILGRL